MTDRFPNLYLVGAAKAGTTALYATMARHPDIYAPHTLKEPNFMAMEGKPLRFRGPGDMVKGGQFRSLTTREEYLDLYRPGIRLRWMLDASPLYLRDQYAPERILQYAPDARIMMVIRNPIEAAFSFYVMFRRDGREPFRDFLKAFEDSSRRLAAGWEEGWDIKGFFRYPAQIRRYLDLFEKNRLLILHYDELRADYAGVLNRIAGFLRIDPLLFPTSSGRENSSPTLRNMIHRSAPARFIRPGFGILRKAIPSPLMRFVRKRYLDAPAFRMKKEEFDYLLRYYGAEIDELESLLKWDLSSWKRFRGDQAEKSGA